MRRDGCKTEAEFGNIIIKTGDDGDVVYLRDVARIELGPETYSLRSMLDGAPAVGIPVFQLPGANALDAVERRARHDEGAVDAAFREGVTYDITYDPTVFVRNAIRGGGRHAAGSRRCWSCWSSSCSCRAGARASCRWSRCRSRSSARSLSLLLLGFSINSLTLFGLVLATGIVVDDAIVVVENIERKMEEGLDARAAAHAAMAEVTRPIISIMLVLCAVFVPVAFLSGITGQFYRQFAVTIAASTVISTFNSLTLSPALAALLLRPKHAPPRPVSARSSIACSAGRSRCSIAFSSASSHAYGMRVGATWRAGGA